MSKGRNYEKIGSTRGTINVLTEKVVEALDNCQITIRQSIQIIAAVADALGHDLETLILNTASFHKIRKEIRKKKAESIKKLFNTEQINFLEAQWDGKLLPDSPDSKKKVDRVSILVTAPNDLVQIIDVPKLDHGTGVLQADSIYKALDNWNLTTLVEAVCCDTTNSNLGPKGGAAVLLEKKLNKDLLYLACRHHIMEVILKACFTLKTGATTEPEVPMFKRFQKEWDAVDQSNFKSGISELHPLLLPEVENKINFIKEYLKIKMPRSDFKEFLELCLIFLGNQKKIKFRKPGACHHARWMSKAIYTLKMYLLRGAYSLGEKETSFLQVCQFIVFVYMEWWFTATDVAGAPNNDIKLVKKLVNYKMVDESIANAAIDKVANHLWYVSPECSALAFFDDSISVEMKKKMIEALNKDNIINDSHKKIPKTKINTLMNEEIDYFINNESLNLFDRFHLKKDFLKSHPSCWASDQNYLENKEIINGLRVVNDVSERSVKLVSDYNNILTTDEEQKQFLWLNVAEYKRCNPDFNKSTLVKKYRKSNEES